MKYPFKTTKERSAIMSKIRGKDTKIEVKLRKALWHLGIRYRKNYKKTAWQSRYCPDQIPHRHLL